MKLDLITLIIAMRVMFFMLYNAGSGRRGSKGGMRTRYVIPRRHARNGYLAVIILESQSRA